MSFLQKAKHMPKATHSQPSLEGKGCTHHQYRCHQDIPNLHKSNPIVTPQSFGGGFKIMPLRFLQCKATPSPRLISYSESGHHP